MTKLTAEVSIKELTEGPSMQDKPSLLYSSVLKNFDGINYPISLGLVTDYRNDNFKENFTYYFCSPIYEKHIQESRLEILL